MAYHKPKLKSKDDIARSCFRPFKIEKVFAYSDFNMGLILFY